MREPPAGPGQRRVVADVLEAPPVVRGVQTAARDGLELRRDGRIKLEVRAPGGQAGRVEFRAIRVRPVEIRVRPVER